jgi:hypothetical protein
MNMQNNMIDDIMDDYLDNPKVIALALAVEYWGLTNQNPNTSPASTGTVLDTANKFLHYIDS